MIDEKTWDAASVEAPPPPPCTLGETKCVGYDLYTCNSAGEWELTKKNAEECGYVPSEFPWKWLAIAGAAIAGGILLIPKPKKAKEKIK